VSERESVMAHLWDRAVKAFSKGNPQDAEKLIHFHDALAAMTEAEYAGIYTNEAVTVA
jgi:hypothetical protein